MRRMLLRLLAKDLGPRTDATRPSSPNERHDAVMAAYASFLEERRAYRHSRDDIMIRTLWIVAVLFVGAFLVPDDVVTRGVFYLGFAVAVPSLMLAGLLAWADAVLAMSVAEVQCYYLQRDHPRVRWPRQLQQLRLVDGLQVERNRYGSYAGVLTFVGTSAGSILLAWQRGREFVSPSGAMDAVLLGLGVAIVLLQVYVLVRLTRSALLVSRKRTSLALDIERASGRGGPPDPAQ